MKKGLASLYSLCNLSHIVGFEILTSVFMKIPIFWDITLCSPMEANQRFG
jgi:hypothetical protein